MISTKKSILYSLSIIISIIIAAILLISKIGNLFMENNIQNKIVFFMIILILILSLLLFIINISLTYTNKKSDLKNNKEQLSEKNNNNTKIEDVNSEKDEIDFNYYSKKFIPTGKYKKDSVKYCEKTLSNIAKELDIVQGLFYLREKGSNDFTIKGKYAYFGEKEPADFELGITLPGQVAKNKKLLNLTSVPKNYLTILSGLGTSSPNNIIIIPVIFENDTIGIIELASFKTFDKKTEKILKYLSDSFGNDLSKF